VPKRSAGLLVYRRRAQRLQVFLVHPGGPYWAKKDLGAWTIPKGEYENGEQPLDAAKREFQEETGFTPPPENYIELGAVKQASGKIVTGWAVEGDYDPGDLTSNFCQVEWPPHSGRLIDIPEVERGDWFDLSEAHERILKSQEPFLETLNRKQNSMS
jgi:predicted NUDIX family NTP pyrophosphohydrolase